MNSSDPLPLRCLALTGAFETGKLPPACFASVTGDFDGQGLSFSALQWNLGQGTLQPLLSQMYSQHPIVMAGCFFEAHSADLQYLLGQPKSVQLAWARSIQGSNHVLTADWTKSFNALGLTPEWQEVAQASAAGYFDRARFQAGQLEVRSDRAIALLFDIVVQNGELRPLPLAHCLDEFDSTPSWGEDAKMRCIANAVADSSNPKWRSDVLARKLTIANGAGMVHRLQFDLAKDFGL